MVPRLRGSRKILVADAVIEGEVVLHLVLVLPEKVPWIPARIILRSAGDKIGGIYQALREIREAVEAEVSAGGRSVVVSKVLPPRVKTPPPGVARLAERTGQRHVFEQLVGIRCAG